MPRLGPLVGPILVSSGLLLGLLLQLRAVLKQRVRGRVVHMAPGGDDGDAMIPVVEFTPPGGKPVRIRGAVASYPPAYSLGEAVGVMYPSGRPADGVIDRGWKRWIAPVLLMAVGAAGWMLRARF